MYPVLTKYRLRLHFFSAGQDIGKESGEAGDGADMSQGMEQENKETRTDNFSAAWKRSADWNCRQWD